MASRVSVRSAALLLVTLLLGSLPSPAVAGTTGRAASVRATRLSPTLSTTHRLNNRRYVVAGHRAYEVGTETGRYPAMGFHTTGEMGGVWSAPLKLLDGIWFGVDGKWLGKATQFTSGWGYANMKLPGVDRIAASRTDFVPDGTRALLIGLHLTSPKARTVEVKVNAHSELMSAYPWGATSPSQSSYNLRDVAAYRGGRLLFTENGTPPDTNASRHHWAAAVASDLEPVGHATGRNFRGPQDPASVCPAEGTQPFRCDDSAFGKGAGGRLTYDVSLRAGKTKTLWFAVGGSDKGEAAALHQLHAALDHPYRQLVAKVAARKHLARHSRVSLPGDTLLARGLQWSKQNLADLTQTATNLRLRATDEGTKYPPPQGTLPRINFFGAGYPDYPWLFATDGEYTSFAALAAGQFGVMKNHLSALKAVSQVINNRSGKVVHEVVTDGSVYFGTNSDPGNTDETVKFPSAVALVWRWTGDRHWLNQMYPFTRRGMHYVFRKLDKDGDLWPEGSGNVEVTGMGDEKLDVAVYAIRGLRDLAEMARAEGDGATVRWATRKAAAMQRRFEETWYRARTPQHVDSLVDPGNHKQYKRYWTGVTPMEAELWRQRRAEPGLTTLPHGIAALRLRQTRCYSSDFGLYFEGRQGCDPSAGDTSGGQIIFTINTAVMAVGEGNYGRLGRGEQGRYTRANRRLQLPRPDEQPGAMPEIAPSKDYGRSIDLPFDSRAQVMQAWGNYGTLWPVIHQQLGVSPDLGMGRLQVAPQVPGYERHIAGRHIRLGNGWINVKAAHVGTLYRTFVRKRVAGRLEIGHVVPRLARVRKVLLNGHPVRYEVQRSNRGKVVLARAGAGRSQELIVRTRP